MSFIESLKRAFGFGPDTDPSDPLFADSGTDPVADRNALPSQRPDTKTAPPAEIKPVEFDPDMQNAIFAKVVEVFNGSLPPFIAQSVDTSAQIEFLRKSLDEGIADYLASLSRAARDYCEQQWRARQTDMAAELDAIRLKAQDVERRSNDIREKQLSADRQKRALTERVHDLESQLARLAGEREQYELENRSLLNRLKVANVQQEDTDKLAAELQAARAEISRMREDPSLIGKEREDALNARIAEMQEGIDTLREQIAVADRIRDEFRTRAATLEADLAARQADLDARESEIKILKEQMADNRRRQAEREKALRDEIEELRNAPVPKVEVNFEEVPEKDIVIAAVPDTDDDDLVPMLSDDDLTALSASFDAKSLTNEQKTPSDEPKNSSEQQKKASSGENQHNFRAEKFQDRNQKNKQKNKPQQPSLF